MHGPSTSLSAGDATFMCGLQEAVTQVTVDGGTVLFVTYDYPAPGMLDSNRHFEHPLAIAIRLGDVAERNVLGTLTLEGPCNTILNSGNKVDGCRNKSLETLRMALPIGCGLPLMEALARRARMQVVMPYLRNQRFRVTISH
jgi:hypothetical protein